MTRMLVSAQLTDEHMPDLVKKSLKEKLQLSMARSNDLQHHWALTQVQNLAWRFQMGMKRLALIEKGEHQVNLYT